MISSIIAYSIAEVEKKKVLLEAFNLYQSKLLSAEQWHHIKDEYASKLYTPSIFVKVLLFIFSLIGLMTVIGPIGQLFNNIGESGYRILSLILGMLILFVTEKLLIKKKFHFKSGVTEAGLYSSLSFLAFAILGSDPSSFMICAIVGFLFTAFAAIRYLDRLALVSALGFLGWLLFQLLTALGGMTEALIPFVFMATSVLLFWGGNQLKDHLKNVIFEDQFVILRTIALLLFYVSGNYFVVRELSISLMGVQLAQGDDIPLAFVFYLLTAMVPMGYLWWGLGQKSISLIRLGLLTGILSVHTFIHYFPLAYPMLTATIIGAGLIGLALVIYNYLKRLRHGFTRQQLLQDKGPSPDLTALIASQTLGGHQMNVQAEEEVLFKGGSFGGAGAGENW